MTSHVPFHLPAAFVLDRCRPTANELAYGHQQGWIDDADVVRIIEEKARGGCDLTPAEDEVLLLLADDFERVPELVEAMAVGGEPVEARERLWMYLALAWLLLRHGDVDDPYLVIEDMFSLFRYPDELTPLVRFLPAPPGEQEGIDGLKDRWERDVRSLEGFYRGRDSCMETEVAAGGQE
jgi:hypothetical protein